jgi:hypothetical protein
LAYLDAVGLINSVSRKFIVRMEKTPLELARRGSGQKIHQLLSGQQAIDFREMPVVAEYREAVLERCCGDPEIIGGNPIHPRPRR